ncbi:MAG TPA: chloride channel protein, partial [Anaerolineae bacterium]
VGGTWTIALVPVFGGLAVGIIRHYMIGHETYHGVPGLMEAVALVGGRLQYRLLPAKTLASALSIGVGASVGPEDPSVQIGANLASMAGQWLHLSDERMRALVAAGAAAGIAAAFNAPIAGVFFALEIVLGEFSTGAFGVVVLAAVVSAIFTQAVSGRQPAFDVPAYAFSSLAELPFYLLLGICAGVVAASYTKVVYAARDFFATRHWPAWLETGVAGAVVGTTGIVLPQIFGVGYDTIGHIFNGQHFSILLLLALLAAKLLMTAVSIGGGFHGGLFAPSLFLGATLGAAFGALTGLAFPALGIHPPAFAMVGMAAVLAGAVHAPLTAVILLFEMTNDYRIILPLMAAVGLSLLVSQRLQPDSIYNVALTRRGVKLQRGRDVEVLEGITVADVMRPESILLHDSDTLGAASDVFLRTRRHGIAVVDAGGRLTGILTLSDLERAHAAGQDLNCPISSVCPHDLLVAHPDESIGQAMRRMSARDIGRLPVVPRDDPKQLLGMLRRDDMVRAYDLALRRRASARHRIEQARLRAAADGAEVSIEVVTVHHGSACALRAISQVPWPHDSMIVTLRRGSQIIIPHGDTVLQPGDVLVTVTEGTARKALFALCQANDEAGPSAER